MTKALPMFALALALLSLLVVIHASGGPLVGNMPPMSSYFVIQTLNVSFGNSSTNPPSCQCPANESASSLGVQCTQADNAKLTASFTDPFVPPPDDPIVRYMVWSVNATVWGRFNCENGSQGANFFLQLAEGIISFTTAPASPSGCACPTCLVPVFLYSDPAVLDDLTGWPGFVYRSQGGPNTLFLDTFQGRACYGTVQLILGYLPAPPIVNSISPLFGPIEGDTVVTLEGSGFRPQSEQRVLCRFGEQLPIVAKYIDGEHVVCITAPGNGTVPLNLVVDQDGNSYLISQDGQHTPINVHFEYYEDPLLDELSPTVGDPSGGTVVTIIGSNFVQTSLILCRFGPSPAQPGTFINESAISCQAPPGWGSVEVEVSLNGQQWTQASNLVFYYVEPPADPVNYRWFIIIASSCALAAVLSCIGVAAFVGLRGSPNSGAGDRVNLSIQEEATHLLAKQPLEVDAREEVVDSDIRLVERIGRGSHGEVFKGYWCGTLVAIKKLNSTSMTPELEADLKHEAKLMKHATAPS